MSTGTLTSTHPGVGGMFGYTNRMPGTLPAMTRGSSDIHLRPSHQRSAMHSRAVADILRITARLRWRCLIVDGESGAAQALRLLRFGRPVQVTDDVEKRVQHRAIRLALVGAARDDLDVRRPELAGDFPVGHRQAIGEYLGGPSSTAAAAASTQCHPSLTPSCAKLVIAAPSCRR